MKKTLIAIIVATAATLGATQVSVADFAEAFRFEFGPAAGLPHRENYKHQGDFQHHGDLYLHPGYGDPYRHTSCVETRVRAEDGRIISRINCTERGGQGVPLR